LRRRNYLRRHTPKLRTIDAGDLDNHTVSVGYKPVENGAESTKKATTESCRPTEDAPAVEEARANLLVLRSQIAREYPGVNAKAGLLRQQMIAVLLKDHPVTEKQWIEKVPLWMRKETDQRQIQSTCRQF
jgi:hypothetical protein